MGVSYGQVAEAVQEALAVYGGLTRRDPTSKHPRQQLFNIPGVGIDVEVDDLNADLDYMLLQQSLLVQHRLQWPSIFLSRPKSRSTEGGLRAGDFVVPIDFAWQPDEITAFQSSPINLEAEITKKIVDAQKDGLPVIWQEAIWARRAFMEGMTDTIYMRANKSSGGAYPPRNQSFTSGSSGRGSGTTGPVNVTVTSNPQSQRAKWTNGYFFSLSKVFGSTDCTKPVPIGQYTFWLASTTPTTSLDLWDIQKDETVDL